MDVIDRKTAIAAGLPKYYTGQPCINGHISERYSLSGSCQACVADSTARARESYSAVMADPTKAARRAFAQSAISVRVPVVVAQIPSVLSMLSLLTVCRFPALDGADFLLRMPKVVDQQGPVGKAWFLIHRDDEPACRAFCKATIDELANRPVTPPITPAKFLTVDNGSPMNREFIP